MGSVTAKGTLSSPAPCPAAVETAAYGPAGTAVSFLSQSGNLSVAQTLKP